MIPSQETLDCAAVVANGSIRNAEQISKRIRSFPLIIAADGGLNNLHEMDIRPDLIIGDMDSASASLLQRYADCEQIRHPADKDETDVELAVSAALARKAKKISLFGALERRIDHSLYNLYLLRKYPGMLSIESEYETAFVIENSTEIQCKPGQTISLFPLCEPAIKVTTKGLKWELEGKDLKSGLMSLSNICIGNSFAIDLDSGALLCCLCETR